MGLPRLVRRLDLNEKTPGSGDKKGIKPIPLGRRPLYHWELVQAHISESLQL